MDIINKKEQAQQAGVAAEQHAKQYLQSQGLSFIEQNFCVPMGEIDLIFKDQNQLVFVEVKYRTNSDFGKAAEYFTPNKRRKIHKAIMCYLKRQGLNLYHTSMRIDVIAIDADKLQWLKNV